jgi:hypothetical protein
MQLKPGVAEKLLDLASGQIASQVSMGAGFDTRASTVLALDGVAFAALLSVQPNFPNWWIPALIFGLSGAVCALELVTREYLLGPSVTALKEQASPLILDTDQVSTIALLASERYQEENKKTLKRMELTYQFGLVVFAVGVGVTGVVLVRH